VSELKQKTIDLLFQLLETSSPSSIADDLGVNTSTLLRWVEKKSMPQQYYFDLCRFAGHKLDWSDYTYKEKDQFFTDHNTSQWCYNKACEIITGYGLSLDDYTFIEPSAGDGSFYNLFPKDRRIGVDIEPRCEGVIETDFLTWFPPTKSNLVIGNPPFGMRGNIALKFINHAAKFADFVCFIVPQSFESDGKGSCMKRVKGLNLVYSQGVDSSFYYPDGSSASVYTVFQVWSKHYKVEKEIPNLTNILKVYSLSDGGTPDTTRNKRMLYSCDYYIQSSVFGTDKLSLLTHFDSIPDKKRGAYGIVLYDKSPEIRAAIESIDWGSVAFISTNGAANLRTSIIENSIWNVIPNSLKEQHQPVDITKII